MGIHSIHEVMAKQEIAEEDFSYLNQTLPLFDGQGGERFVGKKAFSDESCKTKEVIYRSSSKASNLSRETISEYFYLPLTQAAKELNVGLSGLKKRCRELGIPRWPHRKLVRLQTLINNVQELTQDCDKRKGEAIEKLEKEKKQMEEVPNKELDSNVKRFSQACFKAKYEKRKLMMIQNPNNGDTESSCDAQKEEEQEEDTMSPLCS